MIKRTTIILIGLLSALWFCGARELMVRLPDYGAPRQLYVSKPCVDGDVLVCWLTNQSDGLELQYMALDEPEGVPWPHGWETCSRGAIQQHGQWLVYYGAPAFGAGIFRLTIRTNEP